MIKKEDIALPDKNADPWKPYYDADPDERRGWLRMPSGKAPDELEAWAVENGMTLKWVNVKDDDCRSMAFNPSKGPPWLPVSYDNHGKPFFGRAGVDGHPKGTEVVMGGELQLACMPTKLFNMQQQAIQDETDEISMGLGGQYEQEVEGVSGATPRGSLYKPANQRR